METVRSRVNSALLVLVLMALAVLIAMQARDASGGPPDPPGPPGETSGVRLPGVPISSLPYTISAPGAYYLTKNIGGSGPGITINADHVTLDLNGFTMSGTGSNSGNGITDGGFIRTDVTIRNGIVQNWGTAIQLGNTGKVSLDDLRLLGNNIGAIVGTGGIISHAVVRDCGFGIEIFQNSTNWGTEVRDSIISRCEGAGILLSANNVRLYHNVIDSNGVGVSLYGSSSWNEVIDNRITGNAVYGIHLNDVFGEPSMNLVARNSLLANGTAVLDTGTGNRIGTFVGGDASITATNPWSNVVY